MLLLTISALFLGLTIASPLEKRDGWKIPSTTFDSQANFDQYFSYAYPWGNTHNGAARMDNAHVSVGGGQLTLTADYTTGQPAAGSLAIHYLSGTVYGKESFTIKAGGGYDFSGQFLAPVAKGTWPAFWLTGVNGWPPEIDLAEWKGSGKVSFNTLATDKVWITKDVTWPSPGSFQTVKIEARAASNNVDATIKFYLNGALQATQTGKGMVGQPFWMIFDLQMEGSSGSPGPTGRTTFAIKNFSVYSYND